MRREYEMDSYYTVVLTTGSSDNVLNIHDKMHDLCFAGSHVFR